MTLSSRPSTTRAVDDQQSDMLARFDLAWMPSREYRILGRRVSLASNDRSILRVCDHLYAAFRAHGRERRGTTSSPASAPRRAGPIQTYLVREGRGGKKTYLAIDPGFRSFVCDNSSMAVAFWGAQVMVNHLYPLDFLLLHASVIKIDGELLVFLGKGRSGKTTLTIRLIEAGGQFYSDEFAPVHIGSGRIHPFPRALLCRGRVPAALRQGRDGSRYDVFYDHQERDRKQRPVRRWIVPASSLGVTIATAPASAAALFFLGGFSDGRTRIEPLSGARGLQMILDHIVNPGYVSLRKRRAAVDALAGLFGGAPAFTLFPGSPDAENSAALGARLVQAARAGKPDISELEQVAEKCRLILRSQA